MYQYRLLILVGALSLCAGCQPAADETPNESGNGNSDPLAALPSSRDLTKTEIIEVPETGIQLGWGYNLYDATPLPNQCVVFTAAEEPAQTRTMTMKEVTDTYELQQRMNVSAEASVKAMGVEGKGKASFAKNVNLSGSSIHFLLDASVDNGVRFAAPYTPKVDGVQRPDRRRGPAIRLTEAAAILANNPEEFQRQCGTGFVSAVYSGASINAVVSIVTSSSKEKQDIRAEVEVKGWGATAKGSTHMGSETSASSNEKSITVLMVGGRGDSIPKDQAELEAKLKTLSDSAYEAPKDFRMAVTPYESLPNWPQEHTLIGDSTELEQLAGLYGDYTTLYDEIEYILLNPELYAAVRLTATDAVAYSTVSLISEDGGMNELRYLESLQDYVQKTLHRLENVAIGCLADEEDEDDSQDCQFDESTFIESYALRSQLPLRFPVTEQTNTGAPVACNELEGLEKAACERSGKINELKQLLDVAPELDERVTEFWILSKSRSRCRLSITDIGCLSNAEARNWQRKVGKRLLIVPKDKLNKLKGTELTFDQHSATWVDAAKYDTMISMLSAT